MAPGPDPAAITNTATYQSLWQSTEKPSQSAALSEILDAGISAYLQARTQPLAMEAIGNTKARVADVVRLLMKCESPIEAHCVLGLVIAAEIRGIPVYFPESEETKRLGSGDPRTIGEDLAELAGKFDQPTEWEDYKEVETSSLLIAPQQKISSTNIRVDLLVALQAQRISQATGELVHEDAVNDWLAGNQFDTYVVKAAIECNGHDFHEKTKEQVTRDNERRNTLSDLGITMYEFSGTDINASPVGVGNRILSSLSSKMDNE